MDNCRLDSVDDPLAARLFKEKLKLGTWLPCTDQIQTEVDYNSRRRVLNVIVELERKNEKDTKLTGTLPSFADWCDCKNEAHHHRLFVCGILVKRVLCQPCDSVGYLTIVDKPQGRSWVNAQACRQNKFIEAWPFLRNTALYEAEAFAFDAGTVDSLALEMSRLWPHEEKLDEKTVITMERPSPNLVSHFTNVHQEHLFGGNTNAETIIVHPETRTRIHESLISAKPHFIPSEQYCLDINKEQLVVECESEDPESLDKKVKVQLQIFGVFL